MKQINQKFLTGERALFQGKDLKIYDTTFADGESPLKESRNIELDVSGTGPRHLSALAGLP